MPSTQEVIDLLKNKKQNSLEQINLVLIHEKDFVKTALDESKKTAYRKSINDLNYEDYYRHKMILQYCDYFISRLQDSLAVAGMFMSYRSTITDRVKTPYQSSNPILNHQKIIEISVMQELVDWVEELLFIN